ncbi:MAG: chitobiase/beta-hexosaminidase C-terminal domain-containing protein, partial [Calditrichia bacterium]|nr:chitobiase/beta-hexosaminidase C-terminal domain-containing protein [Calditrichia bacterium]
TIREGDSCRYWNVQSAIDTSWIHSDFDDSQWLIGVTGLGYDDGDDATIIQGAKCIYLRQEFFIEDWSTVKKMVFHVDFDDAFVAYLNGYEIARENIGVPGVPPGYQETAITYTEPKICYGENPFQYIISNIQTLLQTGENVLSIQVHNSGIESSDLTLIPFLTLGMNTTPAEPHGVNELIVNMLPKLHTNFKISSSGETLILTSPAQTIVDELYTGELPVDISKGRQPDGSSAWFFFDEPTPEASNSTTGYQSIASDVQFSQNGGFFSSSFLVLLSGNNNGETIYYTTDGSEPTSTSTTYINPILIDETKIIRAIMLGDGVLPGKIITNTYFMNETSTLPVISISSTPANFWDTDSGIYVMGENAEPDFPYFGANFWENWERPINIELFETDGNQVLNSGAGVKIFGGWSRGFEQKSISIFARGKYGNSEFNYQLFSEKP